MERIGIQAAAFAAIGLLIAGCTAMSGGARLETESPQVRVFGGVLRSAEETPTDPAKRRFIYNIHGMGPTSDNYNEPLWDHLSRLGYTRLRDGGWTDVPLGTQPYGLRGEGLQCTELKPDSPHDPPCFYRTFGKYRVDVFSRPKGASSEEVFVYTYFWNDDLWKLQKPYLEGDLSEGVLRQGIGNGLLKRYVMDQGFSDAVAYLGPAGVMVREGVRGSVCVMLMHAAKAKGSTEPPAPDPNGGSHCLETLVGDFPADVEFSFISHSLGSRMLLDALAPHTKSTTLPSGENSAGTDVALQKLADRTRTFFMAANQVPLLGIGRVTLRRPSESALTAGASSTFLDFKPEKGASMPPLAEAVPPLKLDVVAFWDPGDLLGFKVDGGMARREMEREGLRYTTIAHRNTPQWAFLFSWPPAAHDREMETPSASRLILCGGDVGSSGRLKARSCF